MLKVSAETPVVQLQPAIKAARHTWRRVGVILLLALSSLGLVGSVLALFAAPLGPTAAMHEGGPGVELINQVGSVISAGERSVVQINGAYAYVSIDAELSVFNVANPLQMVRLTSLSLPASIKQIELAGNLAYVVLTNGVIWNVDISTPAHMHTLNAFSSTLHFDDLAIYQHYGYALDSSQQQIAIIDLSQPLSLTQVGTLPTSNTHDHSCYPDMASTGCAVTVAGTYLYFVSGDELHVLSLANPGQPVQIGSYKGDWLMDDVNVVGSYAYISILYPNCGEICIYTPQLELISVADPTAPQPWLAVDGLVTFAAATNSTAYFVNSNNLIIRQANNLNYLGSYALPGLSGGLDITGHLALVADRQYGLRAIDVTDTAQPVMIAPYQPMSGAGAMAVAESDRVLLADRQWLWALAPQPIKHTHLPLSPQNIAISGTHAYLAGGAQGWLSADLSNPLSPTLSNRWPITASATALTGVYAYVAGQPGLSVLNVSNALSPTRVTTVTTDLDVRDIVVQENRAYLRAGDTRLAVLDISTPTSPTLLGHYETWRPHVYEVAIAGQYAFAVDDNLRVVDMADSLLRTVSIFHPARPVHGVTVAGHYAYFTEGEPNIGLCTEGGPGLSIVDIADPLHPTFASQITTTEATRDVAVQGNYAYVANGAAGLTIVDVSQPLNPTVVGTLATLGPACHVVVSGLHAFVFDTGTSGPNGWLSKIQVVDISNPASPYLAASYLMTNSLPYGGNLAIDGQYLYAKTASSPLNIIDISNPVTPALVASVPVSSSFYAGIAVADNLVYFSDGDLLQIIDVMTPTSPSLISTFDTQIDDARNLAISGTQLLVPGTGLEQVDVADPLHPKSIHTVGQFYQLQAMTISAQRAYLAGRSGFPWEAGQASVQVVDLSQPTQPSELANYQHAGIHALAVNDEQLYLADDTGLKIFNIWDPQHFINVGAYVTASPARQIQVRGNRTYLLDSIGQYTFRNTATSATFLPDRFNTLIYLDQHDLTTTLTGASTAITTATTLVYQELGRTTTPVSLTMLNHSFALTAYQNGITQTDFLFAEPITVTIRYAPLDVGPVTLKDQLRLYRWDGTVWSDVTTACPPPIGWQTNSQPYQFSVPICQTGRYAVMGPTRSTLLPLVTR